MITPPKIFSSQAAVASGSGLRKWTWSQVTIGISDLPKALALAATGGTTDFSGRAGATPSLGAQAALAGGASPILLRGGATISGLAN
jgi:hypothetical protein